MLVLPNGGGPKAEIAAIALYKKLNRFFPVALCKEIVFEIV
jgi:hypothetical protein